MNANFIIKLNDDGTFTTTNDEKVAAWCRQYGMGVIVSIGKADADFQHTHFMDYNAVMEAADLLIEQREGGSQE